MKGGRTGAKFHADFGFMITSVSEYPEESWLAEHQ